MQKAALVPLFALSCLLVVPAQAGDVVVDVHRSQDRVIIIDPYLPPPSAQRRVVVIEGNSNDCWLRTVTVRVGDNYVKRRVWSCA
ncbi:hypothetical protein [Devosia sp. FKR38]|uniref:hypothetical protein n=1 Tax=Devosia sp. FKR38 TaxID=2562312 RepID=UPI0010C098AC|nr:hypothetical protein [Devosia sp. FKR38]